MFLWRSANSARGFGLIGAMIAVVVVAIVTVTLVSMMGTLNDMTAHANIDKQANDFTRYVQNILSVPQVCSSALRSTAFTGAATAPNVLWNPTVAGSQGTIDHIEINSGVGPITDVLSSGATVSANMKNTAIYLRSPNALYGEAVPWPPTLPVPTVQRAGATYNVFPAKLVMRFQQVQAALGGLFRDKTVDLYVAIPQGAPYHVQFCYQPQETKNVQVECNSHNLYPGNSDCTTLPTSYFGYWGTTVVPCAAIYYVQGTDALGYPMCACQINCISNTAAGAGFSP